MNYLFWAHVVCWIGLFAYVYGLIRKVKNLRRELVVLKRSLEEERRYEKE